MASHRLPHENDPDPDRRLRIGYVSANFYNHPVGRFLLPLFAHHDHRQFEIICYSDESRIDAFTQILRSRADRWHSVETPADSDLADQIRRDRIDILVDLAQHAASNRLLVFARKPAPVQVAWLGYPGTTGLEAMDYRLTDPYLDPPGRGDEDYTERSIRLPHCFWCYEEMEHTPPVNRLPASQNGYITFGCLNRFDKVTEPTLILWRQIMQALPKSRLLIHSKIGDHLDGVRRFFEEGGIAPRRLEFVERKRGIYYIHQYHRFDICLDPFPHGGGTITCDALFMGVPVVTLSGRTVVGRGGASLLNNMGLPELIAHSTEEYLAIVLDLAKNPQRLEQLRASLRERMKASPLMDAKRFTADIEAAYRQMWNTWCAAHPRRLVEGPSQ